MQFSEGGKVVVSISSMAICALSNILWSNKYLDKGLINKLSTTLPIPRPPLERLFKTCSRRIFAFLKMSQKKLNYIPNWLILQFYCTVKKSSEDCMAIKNLFSPSL